MAHCQIARRLGQISPITPSPSSTTAKEVRRAAVCGGNSAVLERKSQYLGAQIKSRALTAESQRPRSRQLQIQAAKRVSSDRTLLLVSTLEAAEGKEDEVISLCQGIVDWMQTKKLSDKQSGLKDFKCSQDAYDKNVYHFWERYDNLLSMNAIRSLEAHTKFMEDVRPCLNKPVALGAYEYKNGQIGHMMNPIGPKGEGGLDDATGQGGGGGGASYQQHAKVELGKVEREAYGIEKMLVTSKVKDIQESIGKIFQFGRK